MECPNCSRSIDESHFPQGLAFCPYCGQDMKSVSQEKERLMFCPYCGHGLSEPAKFCPSCGKKLKPTPKKFSGQKVGSILLERAAKPVAKAVKETFGPERKTRKLYQQWAEYSDLSPDEIPSMETLREIAREKQARGRLRRYLIISIAILIIIAIIVTINLLTSPG